MGNGTSDTKRSNAHTLDWDGNGWYQGTIKVGGTGQYDPNAKDVALKEDLDALFADVSEQSNKVSLELESVRAENQELLNQIAVVKAENTELANQLSAAKILLGVD